MESWFNQNWKKSHRNWVLPICIYLPGIFLLLFCGYGTVWHRYTWTPVDVPHRGFSLHLLTVCQAAISLKYSAIKTVYNNPWIWIAVYKNLRWPEKLFIKTFYHLKTFLIQVFCIKNLIKTMKHWILDQTHFTGNINTPFYTYVPYLVQVNMLVLPKWGKVYRKSIFVSLMFALSQMHKCFK